LFFFLYLKLGINDKPLNVTLVTSLLEVIWSTWKFVELDVNPHFS